MNERLIRRSEDHIRFISNPSNNESFDKNTVEEIRMMENPELTYLFCLVMFDLLAKIVCAHIVHTTPDTGTIKWVVVSYAMSSYNFLKLVFNVGYYAIWAKKTQVHKFKAIYRGLYGLGFALISMGMGLYLEGKINTYGLFGFAAPYVVFSAIILFVEIFRKNEYSLIAFFYVLESIQILMIYINISFPDKNYNWTYTLLLYYVTALIYLAISIICSLAFVIIFINNCINAADSNDNPGNLKQATRSMVYDILFYVIWNGFVYYKLIAGFDNLLTNHKISPGSTDSCINQTIQLAFYVVIGCGSVSFLLWVLAIFMKRELLRETLYWLR